MAAEGAGPQGVDREQIGDLAAVADAGREFGRLVLPTELRQQILAHLQCELPNEGVGLLGAKLVSKGEAVTITATRFFPGRNRRASPTRYDLDLRDLVRAMRAMEDVGEVLGGIVHSHPTGEPTPSVTDLAEANYPESLMVIVSLSTPEPRLRAWQLTGQPGAWQPIEVVVTETY